MSSSGSSSNMKTYHKSCRDQDESQPESKTTSTLLSNCRSTSPASTGSRIKRKTWDKYRIRDTNQQVLVLEDGILIAVPDKLTKPGEIFYVSTSHSRAVNDKNCIFLAVCNGKLCLCCDKVKEPNRPSLELKKKNTEEVDLLDHKESLPFTFLKEESGSYFTLESAANPGYFIYTSNTPRKPVGVTKEQGKENNIQFKFADANVDFNGVRE